jgi:TolB-like protein
MAIGVNTLYLVAAIAYLLISGRFGRAAATATVRSIAVLPFKDIGASNDDEHLGLGLADVIITRLSNLREVNVRPTSAVMKFDQQDLDWIAIAQMLGVDAVLDGSIQRNGDKVRVTARLVRASDQSSIWAGQFDERTRFVLDSDEISAQVVESLKLNLNGREQAIFKALHRAQTPIAYAKGRYYWNNRKYPDGGRSIPVSPGGERTRTSRHTSALQTPCSCRLRRRPRHRLSARQRWARRMRP